MLPLTHESLCASLSPFSLTSEPFRTSQMECNRDHSEARWYKWLLFHPAVSVAWLTVPTVDKLAVLCKMLALSLLEKDFLLKQKYKGRMGLLFYSQKMQSFKSATSLCPLVYLQCLALFINRNQHEWQKTWMIDQACTAGGDDLFWNVRPK